MHNSYNFVFSVGRILRSQVETDAKQNAESSLIKEAIMEGDFVNQPLVEKLLDTQLNYWRGKKGVIIDGYPRSAEQMKKFEEKVITSSKLWKFIFNMIKFI